MFNDKTLFWLCVCNSSPAVTGLKGKWTFEKALFRQADMNNVMMPSVVFISDQDSLI